MINVDIQLPRKNFDLIIQESFSNGVTGIFGPSGSGKTSLLLAISGLETPTQGSITINNRVLFDSAKNINLPVEKRNIGYVFQEGRLFPHLTVEKNLKYGLKKGDLGERSISFEEVVDLLELNHILNSKPSQISGGERQRTALGRSLLSSPEILLLDEPFSALDVNLREQILPFLMKIHQKVEIPILLVSHELPDLLKMTNTLFILQKGKCIGHNEYYELLKDPQVSQIIGTDVLINSIDMQVKEFDREKGLVILSKETSEKTIFVKCKKRKESCKAGHQIKVLIHADDIAISDHFLENVTIQNQLQGTVLEVVPLETTALAIVDAGFKLVVEITQESVKRLKIVPGKEVWCLIKSVAINLVG